MKLLLAAFLACGAATFVHHAHNARFLADYPNMPAWLSPTLVYLAWLGAATVGLCGYLFMRRGSRLAGDGAAPLSAHTAAMNATIVAEAATGTLLALAVLQRMVAR